MNKQKSYLSENLRRLRTYKNLTQDEVSSELDIKRSKLSSFENKQALTPPIEDLLKFSNFYEIGIDNLIKVNLSNFSDKQIRDLKLNDKINIESRVLAITVNEKNKENIELVDRKAEAGYTKGYSDPVYIAELPKLHLPFLSDRKTYRCFQLSGESMLPIPNGAYVIGEFVELRDIKNGEAYVLVTNDGIVFKLVWSFLDSEGSLFLLSSNKEYKPYKKGINEIEQAWKMAYYFSNEIPYSLSINERSLLELLNNKNKNL